jgi:hypothetical protein
MFYKRTAFTDRRPRSWLLIFAVILIAGCGHANQRAESKPVPITGKVTLDGQPLADAEVIFTTATLGRFAGVTDGEGKYTLVSAVGGEQVCEGPCKVTISKFVLPAGAILQQGMSPLMQGGRELLPPQYSSYDFSQLSPAVPKEGGTFDFPLQTR